MNPTRGKDETGATAVLVVLMTTVLVGIVAFTADFGLAYANKRAMQTAADAAALGAAGVFAQEQHRECADIRAAGLSAATIEATNKVGDNDTGSSPATLASFSATCENGDLVVRTTVTGPSPNFFGGIFGKTGDYEVERLATAAVEAGTVGTRLRPLALCASDLPSAAGPGTPFRLYAPGNGLAPPGSCPLPPNPGNWWTLDCPLEGDVDGNGTAALAAQIRNGCDSPVSVVPGQGTLTGVALNNHLANACPSASAAAPFECLSGDPGQPDAGQIEDAWEDVIDSGAHVPIPVFCTSPPGKCATSSVTGTGQNAVFPVHRLVAVQVCGYHFGKQANRQYKNLTVAGCSDAAAMLNAMAPNDNDDTYLVMVARNLQVSNVTGDSDCDLGDENCDGGLRQVRLLE